MVFVMVVTKTSQSAITKVIVSTTRRKSMNKEKQIEEMAKDICPLYEECGSCKKCDEEFAIDNEPCFYKRAAKLLIIKDYRKASEVAEEIFAEIGELVNEYLDGRIYTHDFCTYLAELKKKYTEEGK
jgi:hypothetical protein